MKIFAVLFIFVLSSASFAKDDLKSFATGLDKTLRHLNRSDSRPCDAENLTPSSARLVNYKGTPATVMSEEDAQALFTELKNKKDIPYDFSLAGCEQRAHEMSRLMLLKGITPLKGFASVDENKPPRLEIPHPKKKNERIRWKYHVAPVVLIEKNGELIPFTIDPSMEAKAVPTSQWVGDMSKHNKAMKVKLQFTPANQYDVDGRLRVDPRDKEFTQSNQESLREFKKYSEDPHGEEEWMFQQQLMEDKLNSMPGY
ncbi:protein-glutamine glutaminase family protein [Bdellovibrio sp. HCB-162]|uniref:protein-glutamine glutaminase family protein n=1 Tax=Bdellovibrio sp. HCB-162 TaxID=3394234 RepID=UPI0039BCD4A4